MKRPLVGTLGTLALGGALSVSAMARAEEAKPEAKPAALAPTPDAIKLEPSAPPLEPTKSRGAVGAGIGLNPNQPVLNAGATVNAKDAESLTPTTS
jgi:hypothetical protein